MRYHMSSLAASPVRHQGVRPALTGRTGSRKRSPYPSLPVFGGALLAWWRAFHRFSTKPALFLAAPLLLASHAPPVIFFRPRAQRERQSLAGTAGCPGNALCHRSGLEQELAYPCQSAGRIWAMSCVNRLSDFHSDGSGISPTPPLWKSDPGQPLSESPQSPPLFSHFLS